jgi:hypothetical protein
MSDQSKMKLRLKEAVAIKSMTLIQVLRAIAVQFSPFYRLIDVCAMACQLKSVANTSMPKALKALDPPNE